MAEFTGIKFNEAEMPSFVKVLGINHSILPPISQNQLTIGGRAGAYDFGNTVGTREIAVSIAIIAPEENVMPRLLEELSLWLLFDEAKELVLGDNPDRYYLAKVTGDTDITEEFIVGEGTITFVCTDPYIYGQERELIIPTPYQGQAMELVNTGNAETYPQMSFEITKSLTSFSVVSGDEYVDLGSPYTVDTVEADLADVGDYVLKEHANSLNGWAVPSGISGGTITGTLEVFENDALRQAGLNYGTGSGWHGASMMKDLSQATTDFEAYYKFRINTEAHSPYLGSIKLLIATPMRSGASTKYKVKKTGKAGETYNVVRKTNGWYKLSNGYYVLVSSKYFNYTAETYLYDKMGKNMFAIHDANGSPVFTAYVADATAKGRALVAKCALSSGSYTKQLLNKNIPTSYDDFDGYWLVKRSKNIWYVSLYCENSSGKYTRVFYVKWADTKKTYSRKINRVQVGVQAYSTNPACYMSIKHFSVKTLDNTASDTQIPLILRAGDVLEVDNETGAILKNGRPFYQYLNPSSSFIKLQSGSNGIAVYPSDGFKNGSISYIERNL